jgi:hypothetical protein
MSGYASLIDKEVMLYVLCGVITIQKPLIPSTDSLSCVFH